jgi:hypothetical protein
MSMNLNGRFVEQAKVIQATAAGALTTAVGTGLYVDMANFRRAAIVINVTNTSTATPTDVTLVQATDLSASGEKPLAFTSYWKNEDVAADWDALVAATATGNTFGTVATTGKRAQYIIEIDSDAFDSANGFHCFRFDGANGATSVGEVSYILYGGRYAAAPDVSDVD